MRHSRPYRKLSVSILGGPVRRTVLASVALGLAFLAAGCATTPVPPDPVTTGCPLSATEFAGFFETGTVTLDGVVKPADSINFPGTPNCSFYKWSEQMFLWVTSPAPVTYGGGGRIFNSPEFYDVSPLDASFDRTFIAHPSGMFGTNATLRTLNLRAPKAGSHGLPVILAKGGTLLEIEPPPVGPTGKQLILNTKGETVEIGRIALTAEKKPTFFDATGAVIEGARPLIRAELREARIVQKFMVGRVPIFLNPLGNVVETEQGQADGSVLMAQNGSLVYYIAMVNNFFAYFLTQAKNSGIGAGNQFPATQTEANQVTAFASMHGGNILHPEALAVELKTAWVEAAGLPNPSSYITMMATIPTYNQSSSTTWTPSGQKTVLMALAAIHVVGSTAGQREMIWATFEHENNAPNATYMYNSTSGMQTVNPDFSSAFLFCAANPDVSHLNEPHMVVDVNNNIVAVGNFTISPSNTIRGNAWGAAAGVSPNPIDATDADSNSEIISINNAVRGMLNSADVRNKYIMTGGMWTIGGGAPTTNFGNPGNPGIQVGKVVGTSQLANTTMETYLQGFPTSFDTFSNSCFTCHRTNTTSVSHIYFTPGHLPHGLKPLF